MTFAHVGGVPVEETLAAFGPALAMGFGAAGAWLRAATRRRAARRSPATRAGGAARGPRRSGRGAG
jgi:hypothetical protein